MNLIDHYRIFKAARHSEEARDAVKGVEEQLRDLRVQLSDLHKLLEAFILAQVRSGAISENDFKTAYEEVDRAPELAPGYGVHQCGKCGRSSPLDWIACMYCDEPFQNETKPVIAP